MHRRVGRGGVVNWGQRRLQDSDPAATWPLTCPLHLDRVHPLLPLVLADDLQAGAEIIVGAVRLAGNFLRGWKCGGGVWRAIKSVGAVCLAGGFLRRKL